MAEILHVFTCLVHRFPMREVEEVEAIDNKGLRGCIHGRPGSKRQVLLMDIETLEKFGLEPGAIKENLTVRGLDFRALAIGQELRAGDATLRITIPCDPCPRMEEIRVGLEEDLRGQRGWLCRVIVPGKIRKGDRIELVESVTLPVASEARMTA
jgi:MOSC domain-containing protein YiiM